MFKIFVFIAAVLAAVFIAPMAASAVPYTPGAEVHASKITLAPGGTTRIFTDPGFFTPGETVTIAVSGVDASGVSYPQTLTAGSTGSVSFALTVPNDATGSYVVMLASPSASGSVALNVIANGQPSNPTDPTNPGQGGAASGDSGSSSSGLASVLGIAGLAFTGGQFPGLLIWAVAGMIGLGIALLALRSAKRRARYTV
jgi:hypothetical protein